MGSRHSFRVFGLNALVVCLLTPLVVSAQIPNVEHVKDDRQLLSLQIPVWVPGEDGDKDAVDPYFDSAGRVVRLATVYGVNFRLSPATALENFNQKDYDAALKRFRSIRDCLVDSERSKPNPDLTSFDWASLTDHGAAYACFVLIFSSYETAADVMWWMVAQRMSVRRSYAKYRFGKPSDSLLDLQRSEDFGLILSGGYPALPYGARKNPWPLSIFEAEDYTIVSRFSKSHGMVRLSIVAHRMK